MLEVIMGAVPIVLGTVGMYRERAHVRELTSREKKLGSFLITDVKSFPYARHNVSSDGGSSAGLSPALVTTGVVIASDGVKRILGNLRNFVGGETKAYTRLLDRARREAILRLAEQAKKWGYNAMCNLRLDPSNIGGMDMASIVGAATAYCADLPALVQTELAPVTTQGSRSGSGDKDSSQI